MTAAPERTLVLVRHSASAPDASRPASSWELTARGRDIARAAAARVGVHGPSVCVSSREPKAIDTARLIAGALGIATRTGRGLEEHARETVPFLPDPEAFRDAVLDMFARPGEVVFGEESARTCRDRFAAAVESVVAAESGNVAVVAHGTVMSLWLADRLGRPAADIWPSLGWCAFAALAWPSGRLLEWDAGA